MSLCISSLNLNLLSAFCSNTSRKLMPPRPPVELEGDAAALDPRLLTVCSSMVAMRVDNYYCDVYCMLMINKGVIELH